MRPSSISKRMFSSNHFLLRMMLIVFLFTSLYGFKVGSILSIFTSINHFSNLECLKVLQKAQSRDDGWKSLYSKSVQDFAIPGDSSFPINAYFHKPKSSQEAQKMKDYLKVRRRNNARIHSILNHCCHKLKILIFVFSKFDLKLPHACLTLHWTPTENQANGGCVLQRENFLDYHFLVQDTRNTSFRNRYFKNHIRHMS